METRYNTDPIRIQKRLDEITYLGRYLLDTPGQGVYMPFIEDPRIRLQKYGANIATDRINLESDLYGITRPLNRDNIERNNYKTTQINSSFMQSYPTYDKRIEETRTILPAWTFRDNENNRKDFPLRPPQQYLEIPFPQPLDTKQWERDNFLKKQSRKY